MLIYSNYNYLEISYMLSQWYSHPTQDKEYLSYEKRW